jgi:enoyl-CoA hydratase/carnithine racemase
VSDTEALVDIDGAVAILTFNRPQARNALTWAMYDALVAACERVDADSAIRVFVHAAVKTRGAGA